MKTLILSVIRWSLMFITAAAVSLAHPASANLITNPGFETGDFTGWSSFCAFCSVDATNPHSGQYAAVLREQGGLNQPVNLASGQDYILSFWLASPDVTGSLFIVINGDFLSEIFGDAFDYTQFTYGVRGMGPTTLELFSGGTLYLDDVSLTPAVPEPFSTLWLALPFAGMVALRRFRPEGGKLRQVAASSSRNAVSFSSPRTTKRFPSPRCASAIQIVRPSASMAETQSTLLSMSCRVRSVSAPQTVLRGTP